jgi:hypothetical protein
MANSLLRHNNLEHCVTLDKFLTFFTQIYNLYKRSVQYHNDLHGSDVAQHVHFIMNSQQLSTYAQFNDLDTLSMVVAALCHDVQHDGFNNRYHFMTKSVIHQMYGDEHVQENLHAATTLRLLDVAEYDFLSGNFSRSDIKLIKKRIVGSILNTDMASMKKLRDEFQAHLNKRGIKGGKNSELLIDTSTPASIEYSKQLVSNTLLHACDISTNLREFSVGLTWTDLLFMEFFHQGDTEKA